MQYEYWDSLWAGHESLQIRANAAANFEKSKK
jgi:hypothetical protein